MKSLGDIGYETIEKVRAEYPNAFRIEPKTVGWYVFLKESTYKEWMKLKK